MQAPLRGPADPAIPSPELERGSLPADKRDPGRAQGRDMPQGAAEQAVEAEVVMGSDEAVPATVLLGTVGRAHLDGAQVQTTVSGRQRLQATQDGRMTRKCPPPGGDWQSVQIAATRSRAHPDHPNPTKKWPWTALGAWLPRFGRCRRPQPFTPETASSPQWRIAHLP